jgi:hypothetical protein
MRRLATLTMCFGVLIWTSCGQETNGKGQESPLPVDGSADTWWSPTLHGELLFGLENNAEFADGAFFHAWDFTLTAEARVELTTQSSENNMDTVMYLYRRDAGEMHWGGYIARNDDHAGTMLSHMDKELEAGEYRVMIKGYKDYIRGPFALLGTCEGEGCDSGDDPCEGEDCPDEFVCDPDDVQQSIPRMEGYSASCVIQTGEILGAVQDNINTRYVTQADHCTLSGNELYAWEFYYNYWDFIAGWDYLVWDPDEPLGFEMDIDDYGDKGTLITVDYGGDEMAMTFLFGPDGKLLVYYQHNQTPEWGFSCVGEGQTPTDGPTNDLCLSHYLASAMDGYPDSRVSGQIAIAEADSEHALLAAAAKQYANQFELNADTVVSYSYVRWDAEWGETVEACIKDAERAEMCYRVGEEYVYTRWNVDDATDAAFVCAEIR